MKHLFSADTIALDVTFQLMISMLENAGIEFIIRNEQLGIAKGDIPWVECVKELWVQNDDDYSRAKEIIDEWEKSVAVKHEPWICPNCKETNEGQFTSCWKCGTES